MPRVRTSKPDNYNEPFPKNLRMLMKKRNVTQEDLGKALGKTRQAVGYYAEGSSTPDIQTLAKIARFFNTSTDFLLGLCACTSTDLSIKDAVDYIGLDENAIDAIKNSSSNVKKMIEEIVLMENADEVAALFNAVYKNRKRG